MSVLCCNLTASTFSPVRDTTLPDSPFFHILKMSKIVKIQYTHDVSLATDVKALEKRLEEDNQYLKKRIAWRYRVTWRKQPKRLMKVIDSWFDDVLYWWLMRGSVTEKLMLETQATNEKNVFRKSLLGHDNFVELMLSTTGNDKFVDRDQWKLRAMKNVAQEHETNYENDNLEVGIVELDDHANHSFVRCRGMHAYTVCFKFCNTTCHHKGPGGYCCL